MSNREFDELPHLKAIDDFHRRVQALEQLFGKIYDHLSAVEAHLNQQKKTAP